MVWDVQVSAIQSLVLSDLKLVPHAVSVGPKPATDPAGGRLSVGAIFAPGGHLAMFAGIFACHN